MALITFDELHAEVAAWHAREAAEQVPLAVSLRALDALREALPLLWGQDRAEVVDELRVLLAEQDDAASRWITDRMRGTATLAPVKDAWL